VRAWRNLYGNLESNPINNRDPHGNASEQGEPVEICTHADHATADSAVCLAQCPSATDTDALRTAIQAVGCCNIDTYEQDNVLCPCPCARYTCKSRVRLLSCSLNSEVCQSSNIVLTHIDYYCHGQCGDFTLPE
jgi:hypothetical protein